MSDPFPRQPPPPGVLYIRFGQLAWGQTIANIQAVHDRFGWEHPMDGDYLTTLGR